MVKGFSQSCLAASSGGGSVIGKRHHNITGRNVLDVVTCIECCVGNFCNDKGCGSKALSRGQRGPYCYSCDSIRDPASCTNVTVCQINQQCMLYTPPDFNSLSENVYKSQCETNVGCSTLAQLFNSFKCPPDCCDTDFCNDRCGTSSNFGFSTESLHTTLGATSPTVAGHSGASQSECKHDGYIYLQHNQSHLCVHIITNLHYNWTSARLQCQKEHGDLVVLDTHEKALLVRHWLSLHYHVNTFWIGGKDIHQDNHYYWVNGKAIGSAGDWSPGQPDYLNGNESQDCVSISQDSTARFRWHDTGCQRHHEFICEHI